MPNAPAFDEEVRPRMACVISVINQSPLWVAYIGSVFCVRKKTELPLGSPDAVAT